MPHQMYRRPTGQSKFTAPKTYKHKQKPSYAMYSYPRSKQIRKVQLENHPWCENCQLVDNVNIPAEVVDHITPHRGDRNLFFDTDNIQSLCKECHDLKTGIGQ